jgi:hypothetical protein
LTHEEDLQEYTKAAREEETPKEETEQPATESKSLFEEGSNNYIDDDKANDDTTTKAGKYTDKINDDNESVSSTPGTKPTKRKRSKTSNAITDK